MQNSPLGAPKNLYVDGEFDNLARHYTLAVFVIVSLMYLGCTYVAQQDTTALWIGILNVSS